MVFCCQCWDIDDTRGQTNTQNDNFSTDSPDINLSPPAPQIVWNDNWSNVPSPTPDINLSPPAPQNVWNDKWSNVPSPTVRSHKTFRFFTLEEIIKATNNFDQSSKIGEGGFGSVHMGMVKSLEHPFDNIQVVVKRVKRGQKIHRVWKAEVKVLGEINHQNLVKLIGYCYEDDGNERNSWFLVYEYMPNGSLDDHLSGGKSNVTLSWATRLKIAEDAATGLTYLHEGMGVNGQSIFIDFKPSHILLDRQMNAKLSDFGFVRYGLADGQTHVSQTVVATKRYEAPEYVQTGHLISTANVWSYGIFLEELITGRRTLDQQNSILDPQLLRWVCCYVGVGKSNLIVDPKLEGKYAENSMQKVAFIANKCLAKDPNLRPKMSEVLEMVKAAKILENQEGSYAGRK